MWIWGVGVGVVGEGEVGVGGAMLCGVVVEGEVGLGVTMFISSGMVWCGVTASGERQGIFRYYQRMIL
jgi:hypothetical protein